MKHKRIIITALITSILFLFISEAVSHAEDIMCPYCLGYDTFYVYTRTEATCTTSGIDLWACTETNCDTFEIVVPALGHHYVKTEHKDATCTEEGYDIYTCNRTYASSGETCNSKKTTKIAALGHDYVETVLQEGDCEHDRIVEYRCSRCDDFYQEVSPSSGHDFTEFNVTREPTCEETGTREAVCNICQKNVTEEIPALGHSYSSDWILDKEPTQFSAGHRY